MLIPLYRVLDILRIYSINVKGILHIGAHDCEELEDYNIQGIESDKIIWIDAIEEKVNASKKKGIPNVFCAAISDKEDEIIFNIMNNSASSSILDLDKHALYYPDIKVKEHRIMTTITLNNFFSKNNLDINNYNFWEIDIQGAELLALKGASDLLTYVDAIYIEVNTESLYKNCAKLDEIDEYLKIYNLYRYTISMTPHGWGDALYIKTSNPIN